MQDIDLFGRDGQIRTDDHHTPSVVRYQTALHPDIDREEYSILYKKKSLNLVYLV